MSLMWYKMVFLITGPSQVNFSAQLPDPSLTSSKSQELCCKFYGKGPAEGRKLADANRRASCTHWPALWDILEHVDEAALGWG